MESTEAQGKPWVGAGRLILAVWICVGPVASVFARSAGAEGRPVVTVELYNYAEIKHSELHEAESQAAALFAMAGVRIAWVEYSEEPSPFRSPSDNAAPDFSVRILRSATSWQGRHDGGVDVMGESVIPDHGELPVRGGIANLYYDRVMEISSTWASSTSTILGEAIAHELGHLMLGPQRSPQGVMKVLWSSRYQDLISRCELRFMSDQAVLLQRAARLLHPNFSQRLVVQR